MFFYTTLNIAVTEDRVTANTSSDTKWGNLEKWSSGNHSAEALELLLHGAGWCQKHYSCGAVLGWARGICPAISSWVASMSKPAQSDATPRELPGCGGVGDLCTAFVMWCEHQVGWAFVVHEASVGRKMHTVFGHLPSKTSCCVGFSLAFIKLGKLHAQLTTSPWVSSITSVLTICVTQLIIFCELNPSRGSAAKKESYVFFV